MSCCSGSGKLSAILAIAGAAGIAIGGYSMMTGKSICSMFASCDTAAAPAATVVASESSEPKSCCALGGAKAKAVTASASEKTCSEGAAKAVNASNASTCDKPCDKGEVKAINASASETIECPHLRAQAAAAAAKSEGACSEAKKLNTIPAGLVTFAFAAGDAPVLTPVFRAECGAVAYDCSVKTVCASTLVVSSGCAAAAESCAGKSGCDSAGEVKAINASAKSTEPCQAGQGKCKNGRDGCTGDGKNGCCGGCADKIAEEKASAAKPVTATPVKGS